MRRAVIFSLFFLVTLAVVIPLQATRSLGSEVVISNQDMDEFFPNIAYNSNHNEYLVVWHDNSPIFNRSVMGKRIDVGGNTIAEFVIAYEDTPPRDSAQPDVAYDSTNDLYLVTWIRDASGAGTDWDVSGRIIPWQGPSASNLAFAICNFTTNQWTPRVAYAGTEGEFMVTWWNEGSGGVSSYVSAQRVSTAGALIGSNFVVTSDISEERVSPDIAYNQARNEYLVVYQRMDVGGGNVYGVRMTGAGGILGGGDFGIAAWPSPETSPRVSASRVADEWAVVWQSDESGELKNVYARRLWVDGGGAIQMAAPVLVAATPINERYPDIAAFAGRSDYLIAWEQQYSNSSGAYGIFGRTLQSNELGAQIEIRGVYAGHDIDSANPAIAGAPSGWFVVWQQERDDISSPYLDIYGRAVTDEIFSDGFENGLTTNWSSTNP